MTVSRVTNLEAQDNENKERITALDKAIQERLKEKSHVIVEGVRASRKIGVNILLTETLIFRRNSSAMLYPMKRLQIPTMTSRQMSIMTPTL